MNMQNALLNTGHRTGKVLAVTLVAVAVLVPLHPAQSGTKNEYANTKRPMYDVGRLNPELSKLCRRGLFKQRKILRLSIGYIGPTGQGVTGIAQKGWNLYDPTGAAADRMTYHFFSQGYSNCRVYEAQQPPPRQAR